MMHAHTFAHTRVRLRMHAPACVHTHTHTHKRAHVGWLLDRMARGGRLISIDNEKPLWLQMPYTCDLRKAKIIGGWDTKVRAPFGS